MNYFAPKAYKGQIVLWYEGGVKDEALARPAIVTAVHFNAVSLKVFGEYRDNECQAVRHVDDASAREFDRKESGGWDYTERDQVKVADKEKAK